MNAMYLYEKIAKERELAEKEAKLMAPIPPRPDKRFVAVMGSMSHTYGNALAFIQNWVMGLFPDNMFKTIKN